MTRAAVLMLSTAICLAAISVPAAIKTETVEYQVDGKKHVGYLAWDESTTAPARRPGVLVVPEWWGTTEYPKRRARQLAELGYVAMVADIYGGGKTTTEPKEAGSLAGALRADRPELRKRGKAALDTLKKQPQVDAGRVAAIGYCFGGTTVLEMARSGMDLDAVVSFHGSLDFPDPVTTGTVKAKSLVLHGADDPMVPQTLVDHFLSSMEGYAPLQFVSYPGAVHAFTNPDADKLKMPGVAYQKEADEKSWQAMKQFLKQNLK